MAAHLRAQIRDAVAGAVTGLATTGSRVYRSRVYPLDASNLPGVTVHADREIIVIKSIGLPRRLERTLHLVVAGFAAATDGTVDDVLDQIAKEIEIALAMPCAAIAALAKTITLTGAQIEIVGTADKPVGRIAMDFEVFYMTTENAPDVAI